LPGYDATGLRIALHMALGATGPARAPAFSYFSVFSQYDTSRLSLLSFRTMQLFLFHPTNNFQMPTNFYTFILIATRD
jgi:hypothetical protein